MLFLNTKILTPPQKEAIHQIWNAEYPAALQHSTLNDFNNYLNKLANHKRLIATDNNVIARGWLFSFIREEENWFSLLLIVHNKARGWDTNY